MAHISSTSARDSVRASNRELGIIEKFYILITSWCTKFKIEIEIVLALEIALALAIEIALVLAIEIAPALGS